MNILSRRNVRPLLRQVGGKKHAGAEDYEEDVTTNSTTMKAEEDIHADPVSSDEEKEGGKEEGEEAPPPPASQSSNTSRGSRKRKMAAPSKGNYAKGKRHKKELEGEDMENEEKKDVGFEWGMAGSKVGLGNFHATVGTTFGNNKIAYGKTGKATYGKATYGKTKTKGIQSVSNGSYSHIDDVDTALGEKTGGNAYEESEAPARKRGRFPESILPPESLVMKPRPLPQSLIGNESTISSSNSTLVNSQVNESSADLISISELSDNEDLNEDIPPSSYRDQDSACALCQDEVDIDEQERFWASHGERTVRKQMLFCKQHKRSKAQKDYVAQGYPEINFASLASRIKKYRPELIKLLRNETEEESPYRAKHAARLVSGKAAALPSRRQAAKKAKAQAQPMEQEAFAALDALNSSTGYYGPRGKRIMMETITAELSDVIREVSTMDPVVGRSGFAMFVQTVLVPELTLMLVMEDKQVGKGMASEIIKESEELGDLVHEEIEDVVRVGSEDGEEEDEE